MRNPQGHCNFSTFLKPDIKELRISMSIYYMLVYVYHTHSEGPFLCIDYFWFWHFQPILLKGASQYFYTWAIYLVIGCVKDSYFGVCHLSWQPWHGCNGCSIILWGKWDYQSFTLKVLVCVTDRLRWLCCPMSDNIRKMVPQGKTNLLNNKTC